MSGADTTREPGRHRAGHAAAGLRSADRGPAMLRRGMSLIELLIAMLIFTIIMTASLGFFRTQGRAFSHGNERATVLQNLRYAMETLEQHLHTTGVGTTTGQPQLVHVDTSVIAVNANYATTVQDDPFAVYYDPYLSDDDVSALTQSRAFQLPHSTFTYPDTSYQVTGTNSPAETIIFYFEADGTTDRSDDYVLYRQLNDQTAEVIARNLLKTDTLPFFEYVMIDGSGTDSTLVTAPTSELPASHTVDIHGAEADSLPDAYIDQIRGVRVSYTSTNGYTDDSEQTREISRLIRFPNIDVEEVKTCGNDPLLGAGFDATATTDAQGAPYVSLTWTPATDESSGEQDVVRYVLWKKTSSGADWGDPFLSIPPGETSYSYPDTNVQEGSSYWYALAAQDCTPNYSTLETASAAVPTS